MNHLSNKILLLVICLAISVICVQEVTNIDDPCKPYSLRLNLGRKYYNRSQQQMVGVIFDTHQQCISSYVMFEIPDKSIQRIPCRTQLVTWDSYQTFVHRCSIGKYNFTNFLYMAYGWSGIFPDHPSPYQNKMIQSHLPDQYGPNKFIILADWGYLITKAGIYDPLDRAFDMILKSSQKIDGIYIGGDIAYDLSSFQGQYYQDFVKMLSQVASRWPLLLNIGNHQHTLDNDYMILNKSFEVYGSVKDRVTVLHLSHINWLMFDPYLIVFKGESQDQLLKTFNSTLYQLQQTQPSKPVIVSSHYPFHCNGNIPDCQDCRNSIIKFFQLMFVYNVALYTGAHYHTYERDYPFFYNGSFLIRQSPYTWNQGGNGDYRNNTLLSVVEGIAGNDREIIMQYPPDELFTARYSIGVTGFGKMLVNTNSLQYDHVQSTSSTVSRDNWRILFKKKGGSQEIEEGRNIRIAQE